MSFLDKIISKTLHYFSKQLVKLNSSLSAQQEHWLLIWCLNNPLTFAYLLSLLLTLMGRQCEDYVCYVSNMELASDLGSNSIGFHVCWTWLRHTEDLYTWLTSAWWKRNGDSLGQVMFLHFSIVQYWWLHPHWSCFLSLADRSGNQCGCLLQ